jgi:hypothetical protein
MRIAWTAMAGIAAAVRASGFHESSPGILTRLSPSERRRTGDEIPRVVDSLGNAADDAAGATRRNHNEISF